MAFIDKTLAFVRRERKIGKTTIKPLIEAKEMLLIFVGLVPYGFAVKTILLPHQVVTGGLTGLCEIIYFATEYIFGAGHGIELWVTTLIFNVLLMAIALKTVGWRFCVRTIYGVFCLAFWLGVIPLSEKPLLEDSFMAVVLGGLLCGVGLGIVFLNNGSSGGTDIIAMMVNKKRHMPMGRVLFYCDLIIISSAYFLPQIHELETQKAIQQIIFGLCFTFLCSFAVDTIMRKIRQSVQFFIFSKDHYDEIATAINQQVNRGVTILDGMGWYSKEPVQVVTVLAKKGESQKIFTLVKQIDPNAFVSQSEVIGVYGQGFEPIAAEEKKEKKK